MSRIVESPDPTRLPSIEYEWEMVENGDMLLEGDGGDAHMIICHVLPDGRVLGYMDNGDMCETTIEDLKREFKIKVHHRATWMKNFARAS